MSEQAREQEAVDTFLSAIDQAAARGTVQALVPALRLVDLKLVAVRLRRLESAGDVCNGERQPTDGAP